MYKGLWPRIIFTLIISYVFFIENQNSIDLLRQEPVLFLGKISAITGTLLFSWSFILATRIKFLEHLAGGLDKLYKIHKEVGKYAFLSILLHPFVYQFFAKIPSLEYPLSNKSIGFILGWLSLLLFSLFLYLSLWSKIKYETWKKSHHFIIIPYIIMVLHIIYSGNFIYKNRLLLIWVGIFLIASIASYCYIKYIYPAFSQKYNYIIKDIKKFGDTREIYLFPENTEKTLPFNAGQFVYIKFLNQYLDDKEMHPFSISSYPGSSIIRISVKELGNFTKSLSKLEIGNKAIIQGPYGMFGEKYSIYRQKSVVFIAGGVGITPFLSMLADEVDEKNQRQTDVIYAIKDESQNYAISELEEINQKAENIKFHLHLTNKSGYLNLAKIKNLVPDIKNRIIFICGPLPMMKSITTELKKADFKNQQIVWEYFSLK